MRRRRPQDTWSRPGSSHVTTKLSPTCFAMLCSSLTHHHQLAILPVASISSPPTWNGRHGYLPGLHTAAASTAREDSLARQGPSSLPLPAGWQTLALGPSTQAASFEPKDASKGHRRHSPVHDSLLGGTSRNPAHVRSTPTLCQRPDASPTHGLSALTRSSSKPSTARYYCCQELPGLRTTRISMAGAEY